MSRKRERSDDEEEGNEKKKLRSETNTGRRWPLSSSGPIPPIQPQECQLCYCERPDILFAEGICPTEKCEGHGKNVCTQCWIQALSPQWSEKNLGEQISYACPYCKNTEILQNGQFVNKLIETIKNDRTEQYPSGMKTILNALWNANSEHEETEYEKLTIMYAILNALINAEGILNAEQGRKTNREKSAKKIAQLMSLIDAEQLLRIKGDEQKRMKYSRKIFGKHFDVLKSYERPEQISLAEAADTFSKRNDAMTPLRKELTELFSIIASKKGVSDDEKKLSMLDLTKALLPALGNTQEQLFKQDLIALYNALRKTPEEDPFVRPKQKFNLKRANASIDAETEGSSDSDEG